MLEMNKNNRIKYNDILVYLYFFNMIVFENGSIVSKIGKLIFVSLSTLFVLRNKISIRYKGYYAWLFLVLLYAGCSIEWAYNKTIAISGIKTMALNSLCIFMLTQLLARNKEWTYILPKILMFCPSFLYIRLFLQHGFSIFGGLRNIETGNHNSAGMYAAWGLVFAIYYLIITKDKRLRYKAIVLINFILMMLSMSRKAVIYACIPMVILYLLTGNNINKKIKNFSVLIIITVFAYYAVMKIPVLYRYIGSGLETMLNFFQVGTGDISAAGRRTRIAYGMTRFLERRWFGWGTMNYNALFGSFEIGTEMVIADNNFVDVLVNFGIIGFAIYYFIYLKGIILYLLRKVKSAYEIVMPLAIIVTLLVCDYGVSSYIYLHSQTFLMIGICWQIENGKQKIIS